MPDVLVKYLLNEDDKQVVPSRFVQNLKDCDPKKIYRIFFTKDAKPEEAFEEYEIKAKFNEKLLECLDEPQKGRGRKRKVATKLDADGYYRGKVLIIKDSEEEIRKIMKGKRLAAVPRRFQNENTEDGQPVENKKRKTTKKTHEESEDEDAEYYINLSKEYETDGEDDLKRKKRKTTKKTHEESEDEDEDAEDDLKRKKNQADGSISSSETSDEEKEEEKKKEAKNASRSNYEEEKARKDREKENKMKEKKEREQALKKEKEREKQENEKEKEKEDKIEALKKKLKMMEEELEEAKRESTPKNSKRAAEGEAVTSKSLDINDVVLKHGSKIAFLKWLNINSVKPDARGDSRFIKLLVDALIDKEEQKQKTLSTLDQNKVEEIATCFLERLKKRKPEITPDELAAGMKEVRSRISEKLSTVKATSKN